MSENLEKYIIFFIIFIILYLFFKSLINIFISITSASPSSNKIDSSEGIKIVNDFIEKEAYMELFKWIISSSNIIYIDKITKNFRAGFLDQMTNSQILNEKLSIISCIIYEKMSKSIKNIFHIYYSEIITRKGKNKDVIDEILMEYIQRYVFFIIRRTTIELTELFNTEITNDDSSVDIKTRVNTMIKLYQMEIEMKLFPAIYR